MLVDLRADAVGQQAGDREALAVGEAHRGLALARGQAGDREAADGDGARGVESLTSVMQLQVHGARRAMTVGREVQDDAELLPLTDTVPRPVDIGIGNSPPARNFASWPDSATSVGSASIFARPFDSSAVRMALNGKLGRPEKNSEKPPPTAGLWTGRAPAPSPCPGTARNESGEVPTAPPCRATKRPAGVLVEEVEAHLRAGRCATPRRTSPPAAPAGCRRPCMRLATLSACSLATSAARSGTRTSETSPESTTRSPGGRDGDLLAGEEILELRAQRVEVARHQQREHQRLVALVPQRQVGAADAARREQELRRRDDLEVGDLRVGDRDARRSAPTGSAAGSARSRARGPARRPPRDRCGCAAGSSACSGAAAARGGVTNREQSGSGGIRPAGAASLSLVSSVEVTLLEAIAAQDFDGVLLRRRLATASAAAADLSLAPPRPRRARPPAVGRAAADAIASRGRRPPTRPTGSRRRCRRAGSPSSSAGSA